MGLKIISAAVNKDTIPLNEWYGIQFRPGQTATQVTRIAGNDSLLVIKPIHQQIRHAVVNDDRTVNYWLDRYQLSKKADGSASNLTGADGQVMGLIPEHYRRIWLEASMENWAVSRFALPGFTKVPARWVATFPATLATGDTLESVTGKYAQTSKTPMQFLQYARNRSADWYNMTYQAWFDLYVLYLIELADFNVQSALSDGLTNANSTDWNNYNGYNPLYENGSDADEIVLNGEIQLTIANFVGGTGELNTQVAVYRQFRLLTGIFEWLSGINIHNSTANGSRVFLCDDPDSLAYDTETGHLLAGNIVESDGYIKEMLTGSLLPKVVGGSSSTYYSDYHYSYFDDNPNPGWRAARWFGIALSFFFAGFGDSNFYSSSGYSHASTGSRLCSFANI